MSHWGAFFGEDLLSLFVWSENFEFINDKGIMWSARVE